LRSIDFSAVEPMSLFEPGAGERAIEPASLRFALSPGCAPGSTMTRLLN
jgi:hypothetical protein